MPSARVAGGELHYRRAGVGEPLLLIQGMSANRLSWGRPFSSLLEQSFECIAFDNRGMGLSSPVTEPFTIAEMASDAAGLLDALEIERAHVFGISMGGMIAQELALASPERILSLTLGCTYCGGPGSQLMAPADARAVGEAMASGEPQRYFDVMWEVNFSAGFGEDGSRYAEFIEMAEARPISPQAVVLQIQAIAAHDTSARLAGISAPTMVVHGTVDRVLPVIDAEQIVSRIPRAKLELLEGIGHMFWWEQPERSARLIREHASGSALELPVTADLGGGA